MRKSVFALAALAAFGFIGTAFAGDARTGASTSTAPQAMSDSEMDKVTAAGATVTNPGTIGMTILLPEKARATEPHANFHSDGHPPTFIHP